MQRDLLLQVDQRRGSKASVLRCGQSGDRRRSTLDVTNQRIPSRPLQPALERTQKKSSPKPNRSYHLKKCLKSNRIASATTATVTRSMMATNAFLLAADSY